MHRPTNSRGFIHCQVRYRAQLNFNSKSMACPTSSKRSSGWYTRAEVSAHCTMGDLWVIINGTVLDISPLLPINPPLLSEPLVMEAGGDISEWFDYDPDDLIDYIDPVGGKKRKAPTGDLITYIDPVRSIEWWWTPMGRFCHIAPVDPRSDWDESFPLHWWRDPKYIIGRLSARTRLVRIKNVLIGQEILLEVPSEETIREILERYLDLNLHAKSYTWKANCSKKDEGFVTIDYDKTLEQNGIPDERPEYDSLEMGLLYHLPCIQVYYNDDLTIA